MKRISRKKRQRLATSEAQAELAQYLAHEKEQRRMESEFRQHMNTKLETAVTQ